MFTRPMVRGVWCIALVLAALVCGPALGDEAAPATQPAQGGGGARPLVQVAIVLDTSGSMEGLINQARSQIWTIISDLARTRRNGQAPRFEVALYEYGNSGLPAREGFVRMILPLTEDLDAVSEKLFALSTNGGDEYCGQVISDAVAGLAWSTDPWDYRAIFIAGNEPFTQGQADYRKSCSAAVQRGIIVNTIHCGDRAAGESTGWRDGARLGDGQFLNIQHDQAVVAIATPQDAEIERLSAELNTTYLPYGAGGDARLELQSAQDANAATGPAQAAGAGVARGVAKASVLYRNAGWDLVDAVRDGAVKLDQVETEALPQAMREMDAAQRAAHVQEQGQRRQQIQQQINELASQRQAFVVEKQKEQAGAGITLDQAVLGAVREQIQQKQFEVPAP